MLPKNMSFQDQKKKKRSKLFSELLVFKNIYSENLVYLLY